MSFKVRIAQADRTIDVPTGAIVRREGYADGTSRYNFEIGTDRMGSQFAIPTYGGTYVYDDAYQRVATIGQAYDQHPIGVAYHPVERKAYFPWSGSRQVRVYDMDSFAQVGSHDLEHSFGWVDPDAGTALREHLSEDGELSTDLEMLVEDARLQPMSLDELLSEENVPPAVQNQAQAARRGG